MLDTIPFLPFVPYGLIKVWWKEDKLAIKLLIVSLTGLVSYLSTGIILKAFEYLVKLLTP